ncbi:MAG: tRNA 2-thiouridine(34) synthase MnmA [Clostridia bacterium]|jgi:tRNA-specific 2-thiouridylase|nr:tRNA 2-thiouridine(34) synthase MnmA [Clostridia bacterium]
MNKTKKTVVMGMSGGVDSSVAAYLLKQQGFNVIGLFMINWQDTSGSSHCSAEEDFEDVKRVCNVLQIPYYSVNYEKEYRERVFSYFLEQYKKGRTPNPDVLCNKEIKFGPFLEQAEKLGATNIATGHYAKKIEINGKYHLVKAADLNKDQSYFLHQLNQKQLEKILFPLADITKPEVRKIATELGFSTAKKKDSTGICFIGERNFKNFLKDYFPIQKGDIITQSGEVVGRHDGLMFYTIGQRRGLGIGGIKGGAGGSWFVLGKDLKSNKLIVSQGETHALYSNSCECENFNWIPERPKLTTFDCSAKFRYRQPDQRVTVNLTTPAIEQNSNTTQNKKTKFKIGEVFINFHKPQRAITPGQYAVLYDENGLCLGGGEIMETIETQQLM